MFMLLFLITVNSIIYSASSHPVLLTGLILIQAVLICATGFFVLNTSWFSYILFLIFLGGLMVLFIYITSLASNESIKMPSSKFLTLAALAGMVINTLGAQFDPTIKLAMKTETPLINMYSNPSVTLISVSMIYLLLTLIVVVKITSSFESPIKNLIIK